MLKVRKNCADLFSTSYVGWVTCTLNLVQILVLHMFKGPQRYKCPKNFDHDCSNHRIIMHNDTPATITIIRTAQSNLDYLDFSINIYRFLLWSHFSWILMSFDLQNFKEVKNSEIMFKVRKSAFVTHHIASSTFKRSSVQGQKAFWHIQLHFYWFNIVLLLSKCHAWSLRLAWVM